MACNFCKEPLYVKTIQYAKPLCAPMTKVDELRYKLLDLTGEVYVELQHMYCPICGEKIVEVHNV